LILKFFIFFPESFNATRCVDEFLFAGKKWMALGADFHTDIGFGRAYLDFIAACASDAGYLIFRMNSLFHDNFNPLKMIYSSYCAGRPGIKFNFGRFGTGGSARRLTGIIWSVSRIQGKIAYVNRDVTVFPIIFKFFE